MSGIKRTEADRWFSNCVRERAGWACERCGKQYPDEQAPGLHASHIYGRGNYGVRFHPDNCLAHCHGCHQYLSANPLEFARHAEDVVGHGALELVVEKKNCATSGKGYRSKAVQKEIAAHYRSEYRRMRDLRLEGVTGRIEFVGYD